MGLFQRRIRVDGDLSRISAERLLREYAKYSEYPAFLNAMSQEAEFASKENPMTMDPKAVMELTHGAVLMVQIGDELRRRGISPPSL